MQAVISGGLVFLAVLADRWFGFNARQAEWMGVALTAIGLAFLGLTCRPAAARTRATRISGMIAFEGAMIFLGALLLLSHRVHPHEHHRGLMLGAAAGILFGVSDIAIKALTGTVPASSSAIISPWTLVAVARLGRRLLRLGPRPAGRRGRRR